MCQHGHLVGPRQISRRFGKGGLKNHMAIEKEIFEQAMSGQIILKQDAIEVVGMSCCFSHAQAMKALSWSSAFVDWIRDDERLARVIGEDGQGSIRVCQLLKSSETGLWTIEKMSARLLDDHIENEPGCITMLGK